MSFESRAQFRIGALQRRHVTSQVELVLSQNRVDFQYVMIESRPR